ncbi:MAG: Uma2 family endonuclease [Saprospirales bacterium]|nr:Uma2 family endonuclease [Saprospirales bacterium]MBK8492550.1 Uma2 family endonuclease [Saprospirales bacterium]
MTYPSTKPVTKLSDLDPEGSYTYADYLLWKFKERVELIHGRLFKMTPAPNTEHQRISSQISRVFLNFFYKKTCQVFVAPFDVRLPVGRKKGEDSTVVQPDLCVICEESKLDERGCKGAPDLMVEILSPGNSHKEMREKFQVYEEAGVREYWLVNSAERLVLIYILNEQGVFIGLAPVTEEVPLRSHIFPELEINLKEVFNQ